MCAAKRRLPEPWRSRAASGKFARCSTHIGVRFVVLAERLSPAGHMANGLESISAGVLVFGASSLLRFFTLSEAVGWRIGEALGNDMLEG
jgi:hypothetical protein